MWFLATWKNNRKITMCYCIIRQRLSTEQVHPSSITVRLIYIIMMSYGVRKGKDLNHCRLLILKDRHSKLYSAYAWILTPSILHQGSISGQIMLSRRKLSYYYFWRIGLIVRKTLWRILLFWPCTITGFIGCGHW